MVPLSMTLTLYLQKCVALFVGDSWVSCFMQYSHWISDSQEWIWHNHPIHPNHCDQLFYRASACYACRARYCFTNSDRLSVQCQYVPIEMDISSHFFDILVGESLQFFVSHHRPKIPIGTPLIHGVGKFCPIFDWNHRLSRKRYEIDPWLLWNVNRKS